MKKLILLSILFCRSVFSKADMFGGSSIPPSVTTYNIYPATGVIQANNGITGSTAAFTYAMINTASGLTLVDSALNSNLNMNPLTLIAVRGITDGLSNGYTYPAYGGFFKALGTTNSRGVYGEGVAAGSGTSYGGYFEATGNGTNYGIWVNSGITALSSTTVNGYMQLKSLTAAVIRGLTPTVVGQLYYCSDCSAVPTCISTGTIIGSFAITTAKTTACN